MRKGIAGRWRKNSLSKSSGRGDAGGNRADYQNIVLSTQDFTFNRRSFRKPVKAAEELARRC